MAFRAAAPTLILLAAAEHQLFQPLLQHGPVSSGALVGGVAPHFASAGQAAPAAHSLLGQREPAYAEPLLVASDTASSTVESQLPWVFAGVSIVVLVLSGRHPRGARPSPSTVALLSVQGEEDLELAEVHVEQADFDVSGMSHTATATEAGRRAFLERSFGAAGAAALLGATPAFAAQEAPMELSSFLEAVDTDLIERVSIQQDGRALVAIDKDGNRRSVQILPGDSTRIIEKLRSKNVIFAIQRAEPKGQSIGDVAGLLLNLAFPILALGALLNLSRGGQGGAPGGGPPGMG